MLHAILSPRSIPRRRRAAELFDNIDDCVAASLIVRDDVLFSGRVRTAAGVLAPDFANYFYRSAAYHDGDAYAIADGGHGRRVTILPPGRLRPTINNALSVA